MEYTPFLCKDRRESTWHLIDDDDDGDNDRINDDGVDDGGDDGSNNKRDYGDEYYITFR